jgi:hypothetical protein
VALTPTVLTDAFILINAGNVSDHGNKVEIPVTVQDKDSTTFGQSWVNRVGGLKDAQLSIDFLNDFVAAQLDSIFWPLLGTVVTFEIRPTSAGRGTGNPAYTGSIFIKEWKPIAGKVGDLVSVSVSFPTSGTVLRQTS